jgi:hypothetical protein
MNPEMGKEISTPIHRHIGAGEGISTPIYRYVLTDSQSERARNETVQISRCVIEIMSYTLI